METAPILEVRDLACRYEARARIAASQPKRAVIDGISFSIGAGECLGLLGESGSGKSTIASCIVGFTRPESGVITVLGENVYPQTKGRKNFTGRIQMLYQDHSASLDPVLTVRASMMEAFHARRRTGAPQLTELLEAVGLPADVLDRYPRSLSGGERQRVALARSLVMEPALLVLDEPTSALDHATQIQILDLVASVRHTLGTAVLFITHDIDAAARICSHIAILHEGRIVENDTTAAVLSHPVHPYTRRIVGLYHS